MALAVLAVLHFAKNTFVQIFAGVIAGAAVYALCTVILKADTALMLVATIKKRIKK